MGPERSLEDTAVFGSWRLCELCCHFEESASEARHLFAELLVESRSGFQSSIASTCWGRTRSSI